MSLATTETAMSDQAFHRVAKIAIEDAGLSIPESKKALVQSRIARRLRVLNLESIEDYLGMLDDHAHGAERKELISILTTNVSSFFRERHHFQHLSNDVFPLMKKKLSKGEKIKVWSSACSSGQEPFSIGIEFLKNFNTAELENILILATDIDPSILTKARSGKYPKSEIESLPKEDQKYFRQVDDTQYQVQENLMALVRFRELNLHSKWPMQGAFDAIFCRNVLIYFDDLHQQALWPRFHNALMPSGFLYLGHSERIHPLETSGFASIGATIYQKTT